MLAAVHEVPRAGQRKERMIRSMARTLLAMGLLAGVTLVSAGCATPIQVARRNPHDVERELDSNVISTGRLSAATAIALHREDLHFDRDPEGVIARLHERAAAEKPDRDALFALAEMSFYRAEDTGDHAYFLAAAIYAYAFLFPEDPHLRPSAFDPRFRTACDIYNRSLTWAFASADRSRFEVHSGQFALPFGTIDIAYDPAGARWGDEVLSDFTPADELGIAGLSVRYRRPGIGASLAADATPPVQREGFQVEPNVKVPVTALLRVDASPRDLAEGHLRGTIEVHPAFEPSEVTINGQSVPLDADTTTAFAVSLSDPKIWESELAGFFDGNFFDRAGAHLVGLEPYRRGQIPIVFIHGTGSSPGRWANLINDLQADPVIRENFQFWSFTYATGNPTSFSAERLRGAIETAVRTLDPENEDPALQQLVLIGHSQGGLLAKWLSIDTGSRVWDTLSSRSPEELRLSLEASALLRRVYFVEPVPQVRRVIFIATPQHGSFLADNPVSQLLARLVKPHARSFNALREFTERNREFLRGGALRSGSLWSMSPSNPTLSALAATPISPNIAAHSIIAVEGEGPIETGDDGVVSYQSAHIPEAESELVVRSGHSVQDDPRTVAEVRRILLLHLAQACPNGCAPPATASASKSPD
jgi:pimeloyl-ACP methyl ester carboxylesterase